MTTEDDASMPGPTLNRFGGPLNTPEQADEFLSAELISQSVLIQLTDTVWVNPQHIVGVEFYAKDHMTSADDPRVIVYTTAANHVLRDRTLAEVVALINGDAP